MKIRRCLLDGEIFNDIDNKAGALTAHMKQNYPHIVIPKTTDERIQYYKEHNENWWEKYFMVIEIPDVEEKIVKEVDEDTICKMYVEDNMSIKDIALKLGKTTPVIRNIIVKHGHQIRPAHQKLSTKPTSYIEDKYKPTDKMTFKAVCKTTGAEFTDFNDKEGSLTRHVANTLKKPIPNAYTKKACFLRTGNYWFEEYFDIIQVEIGNLDARKQVEDEICRLYTEQKFGIQKIAKLIDVPWHKVQTILINNNIEIAKKNRTKLATTEINEDEICKVYQSSIISIETLASMFHLGKIKIREILTKHGIQIRSRGGQTIRRNHFDYTKDKFQDTDSTTYVAICKTTGQKFQDYKNLSGQLTAHVQNTLGFPTAVK